MSGLAELLSDCLKAVLRGESDPESCAAKHPKYKTELLALLRLATALSQVSEEASPSPTWRSQAKESLLSKVLAKKPGERVEGL